MLGIYCLESFGLRAMDVGGWLLLSFLFYLLHTWSPAARTWLKIIKYRSKY